MQTFLRTLALAQRGDAAALEQLIKEFAEDVRHVCLGISLEQAVELSRSDLNQEAWMRIWLQLNRFLIHQESTDPRQQFRVWLKETARHEMLRVLERRGAKKRKPPQPVRGDAALEQLAQTEGTPSAQIRKEEDKANLMAAVARLDQDSREAITLCFFEGYSVQAMADKLRLSRSVARTRLSRAVTELRKYFVDPFP